MCDEYVSEELDHILLDCPGPVLYEITPQSLLYYVLYRMK